MTIVGVELNSIKNANREVTSEIRHVEWLPDCEGKKPKNE